MDKMIIIFIIIISVFVVIGGFVIGQNVTKLVFKIQTIVEKCIKDK